MSAGDSRLHGVVDEEGNVYTLCHPQLGSGGQGTVYRTTTPHVAVKVLGGPEALVPPAAAGQKTAARLWSRLTQAAPGHAEVDRAAVRRRIEDVKLLPLADLRLAQPLALLETSPGYTMRLLDGMAPLRSLIAPPGTTDLAAFYLQTGGLERRLSLLADLAHLLARLHAVPLVYADLSPNNVFVPAPGEPSEVWLIDLDNLTYATTQVRSIHTPGFGAPEVVRGEGVTTLSDAWAFAVVAFWVLAQVHPFLGDYVEEAGWDDDQDREAQAFRGELPWIEDPEDDLNRASTGLPRDRVLPNALRTLFERCFGPGRVDPARRPGMGEWADVLQRVADRVVRCGCGVTFEVARACPACGAAPSFLYVQANRWDPDIDEQEHLAVAERPVWTQMLDLSRDGVVRRHVARAIAADEADPPVLRVRRMPGGLALEPLEAGVVRVVQRGRITLLATELRVDLPTEGREVYLHFGPAGRPHRVAVLRWYGV